MRYRFNKILRCNMCDSLAENHKILGRRLNGSQGLFPNNKIGITTTIIKCDQCDLIYSNPQPLPIDIQDHYGLVPESYWTRDYFDSEIDLGTLIPKLQKHIRTDLRPKALDIGAGIGKTMIALEKQGFDVFGIEPSIQFYERAKGAMKIPPDKIQCISIEDAEYPKNTFDFITFGAVLEHLENPSDAIEKSMRWLKSGGIVQIQVPSSNWLTSKIFNLLYKLTFSNYCANLSPMHSPFHLYEFGLESFRKNSQKHNYSIVDIEYVVCETFLPKSLDFIFKPIMKKTKTGMEIYLLLQKN